MPSTTTAQRPAPQMSGPTSRGHAYTAPASGSACTACGMGPSAPQHQATY